MRSSAKTMALSKACYVGMVIRLLHGAEVKFMMQGSAEVRSAEYDHVFSLLCSMAASSRFNWLMSYSQPEAPKYNISFPLLRSVTYTILFPHFLPKNSKVASLLCLT